MLAGKPQQAASAERLPVNAAAANFRLGSDAARRTSASDRIAAPLPRNPAITQRNLVRDQPQAKQGQIADVAVAAVGEAALPLRPAQIIQSSAQCIPT